jgi:hypothetical protein
VVVVVVVVVVVAILGIDLDNSIAECEVQEICH